MPQTTLIYNPLAGPATLEAPISLVADFWRARGWQVSVQPTQYAGHAAILAKEAASIGCRLVLAAGGDGTLGEAANGLAGTEAILGLLPLGTGNSFAKELQMPRPTSWDKHKLLQAADALAAGQVHRMDLGMRYDERGENGRYWALWAGVGVDGFLVDQLEPRPKWSKKLGTIGYALQALTLASRIPFVKATVDVDGRVFTDRYMLALVSNCRRYAGGEVLLSPQAKLDDGLFEVWLFRGDSPRHIFQALLNVKLGRHLQDDAIAMVNGRRIAIHTEPIIPAQTDGDRAGDSPLICEVKPGALRVLVPDTAPSDLFSLPGEPLLE
ncbi:MAG: diacylglycerol kinase family lipid kinase [Chloroflexi bacterium]|nr:diacylglycerol kinase family lipid kinase [Chloroflexota bacterium]